MALGGRQGAVLDGFRNAHELAGNLCNGMNEFPGARLVGDEAGTPLMG